MRLLFIFCFLLSSQLYSANEVERLISEGSAHNNFFLYDDALIFLNEAISRNPSSKSAYEERALSYFELNRIDLALKDFEHAVKLKSPINRPFRNISTLNLGFENPTYSFDFARGLLNGALSGSSEGTIEFISSVRGGLTFLWSFACSPYDVSKELVEALYELGGLIASGNLYYLLEEALPEFFECARYWDTWSEYTKGLKLGFIVGKYSILAFYYITSFKGGTYYFNKLKRSNIMAILERYSITKSPRIIEESAKHAKKSGAILKKAASGSIIPHNPNVLPHIFTKKHRWDKFITLTGDHQKDFEKLATFLEKHRILQCTRRIDYSYKAVITYKYTKVIGSETIVALFEITKDGIPLLRNAWVEVKIPYRT